MRHLLLPLTLLPGCIESELTQKDTVSGTDTAVPQDTGQEEDTGEDKPDSGLPAVSLSAPTGVVLDPKLQGEPALRFVIDVEESDCDLGVHIDNGIGQTRALPGQDVEWDGRDDLGLWFEPGPARGRVSLDCGDGPELLDELSLHIVRLGIQAIDLHSPEGEEGNVPLAFHKTGLFLSGVSLVGDTPEYQLAAGISAAAGAVDDDSGQPREVERWTNPDTAPWATSSPIAHNVPAGFVASSPIQATLTLGAQAISSSRLIAVDAFGSRSEDVPPIRLVGSEADLSPGGSATVDLSPASETMGREIRSVQWDFESVDDEGIATPIPGFIQTEHTLYTLAGQPALLDGTHMDAAPPVPWIGVLEDTAEVLDGVAAEPAPVLDALRDYLFEHDYIIYDPGDAAYTDFTGAYIYWSSITADLTGFLDRSSGLNLYCHSMSCLLSALAGNVGVEAQQIVLGVGFTTNQTRAAGTDSWQRWGFNSHSVVTPDGGETIWDSSIALDGDDEPDSEPIEEVMPRGMDGAEYFWRLTYDDISIVNGGLCFIR